MFETTVTLVGTVLSSPKVRETAQGNRVASFRMVSTARRYDKASGEWVDGDRVFATVQCWRRLAEGVSRSVYNHDPVVVTGRLRTREYEHDGQRRSVTEIEATSVGLDLARSVRERPEEPVSSEVPVGPGDEVPVVPHAARSLVQQPVPG